MRRSQEDSPTAGTSHHVSGLCPESPTLLSARCKSRIISDLFPNPHSSSLDGRGQDGPLVWSPAALLTSARCLLLPAAWVDPKPHSRPSRGCKQPPNTAFCSCSPSSDTGQDSRCNEIPQTLHRRRSTPHQARGQSSYQAEMG